MLGAVSVHNGDRHLSGLALGGRRARVALVALALTDHPIPAERLAAIVWGQQPPPTWQPALRGVIRALRTALTPLDLGDQRLVVTVPAGYALTGGATTDLRQAAAELTAAESEAGPAATLRRAEQAIELRGENLLPAEDGEWLRPYREWIDQLRTRAVELVVRSAGSLGEHHRALAAARGLLDERPLDERAHRTLIGALDRAGDRAGAVQAYERCRAILAEQLGVDPSGDTVAVYLQALTTDAPLGRSRPPAPRGAFVGRTAELAQLTRALTTPGLVTVTGRGGVGKSRLALTGSAALRPYWVALTTPDQELVASEVALELGLSLGDADPAAAVIAHLAPLGRTVLVVDGCEPVLDGVASLVGALLAGCPQLTVLATSRSTLGLDGEQNIHVDPLPAVTFDGQLAATDQLQLLVKRVSEAGGELDLTSDPTLIAALCQRCAGLPLALELVAAQLTVVSPADLLDLLADTGGDRLDAVLDSSYRLLAADEAAVLRRCTVLGGAVSLPLIRSVVSDEVLAPIRVIRILRELADRGLLAVDRSGPRWRYRQDDDIRRFAAARLTEAEQHSTFTRLAGAVRKLLPADAKAPPGSFTEAVTEVMGSVRSLLAAAVEGRAPRDSGLELAFRLHRYWAATNVSEGRFWFSRLLDGSVESPWTGLAEFAYGYLSYWAGDAEAALPILDRAARQLRGEHEDFAARALIYLGGLADDLDRGAEAVTYVKDSVVIAERLGEPNLYVGAAMGVAAVLGERGDPTAADYAADAIRYCRAHAAPEQLAAAIPTAVMICWQVGAFTQARALLAEGWQLHPDGRRIARVVMLSAATGLAMAAGDIETAIESGLTADREATELGVERELPLIRCLLARALLAAGRVDEAAERTMSAIEAARALTYQHPMAMCLETAALVAADYGDSTELSALLATAAELRRRGARPTPPSLAHPLLTSAAAAFALPVEEAAAVAVAVLGIPDRTGKHAKGMA